MYGFMQSGLAGTGEESGDLLAVQAALLVFLNDAIVFSHLLYCCWAYNNDANGGTPDTDVCKVKVHELSLIALKVKAMHGINVNAANMPQIEAYMEQIKALGGAISVVDNIDTLVDGQSDDVKGRMDILDKQVAGLSVEQRRRILDSAERASANYATWAPVHPVSVSIKNSITALEGLFNSGGIQSP